MLIGQYQHALDIKGRINFPSKLRESLGERFILTQGLDGCLFVYPLEEWTKLEEKLNALPMSKGRALQRFFFSNAMDVEADKQGRVLIPQNLREYAGLTKDIVVIGASTKAEIWDKDRWQANRDAVSMEDIESAMDELGF